MDQERQPKHQRRFLGLRHQNGFNPVTSWTREEMIKGVGWAFAATLVGFIGFLTKETSLQESSSEPLPIPLSGRWSSTSPQGWRVRQTEELLLKGKFDMHGVPSVIGLGEFDVDGRKTGIVLSEDTFLQIGKVDPTPVVRATIALPEGKEDILLPTFSAEQRWMVTFEHPDSRVVRHFHILPQPDGKLQVVPMELTPRPA